VAGGWSMGASLVQDFSGRVNAIIGFSLALFMLDPRALPFYCSGAFVRIENARHSNPVFLYGVAVGDWPHANALFVQQEVV